MLLSVVSTYFSRRDITRFLTEGCVASLNKIGFITEINGSILLNCKCTIIFRINYDGKSVTPLLIACCCAACNVFFAAKILFNLDFAFFD